MISVIIPVYNAVEYLPQCVESILRQTFTEVEIVLVDDGSADGSAAMCASFAAKYPAVKYLANAGKGVSQARNTGIANASGEYIAFADADDCYLPGALELMASVMAKTEQCDIVAGQFTHKTVAKERGAVQRLYSGREAIVETLYQNGYQHPSACAKLYRRSIFDNDNIFVAGRRYEDLEACVRFYMKARKVAVLSNDVYYYRPNPNSFINTWSDSRIDALWAVDAIERFVADNCPEALPAAQARKFSAYYNIFNLAVATGRNELATECWHYIAAHRGDMLADRKVRLKNKAGALLAYSGRKLTGLIGRLFV